MKSLFLLSAIVSSLAGAIPSARADALAPSASFQDDARETNRTRVAFHVTGMKKTVSGAT